VRNCALGRDDTKCVARVGQAPHTILDALFPQ
jgi:hypothetical protein